MYNFNNTLPLPFTGRVNFNVNTPEVKITPTIRGCCAAVGFAGACVTGYGVYKRSFSIAGYGMAITAVGVWSYNHVDHEDKDFLREEWEHEERMAEIKHRSLPNANTLDDPIRPVASETTQSSTSESKIESFNDAIERGRKAPERGWHVPGIIKEGDITILYAEPKTGKSILATQIAIEICNGSSNITPEDWVRDNSTKSNRQVIYYDAEMSENDVTDRYNGFVFPGNMFRIEAHFSSPTELSEDIVKKCDFSSNQVFVIDNATSICPRMTEDDVRAFANGIKQLQEQFSARGNSLSVIIVSHTIKRTSNSYSTNCSGSVSWHRFCDETLVLGKSNIGDDYRTLKVENVRHKVNISSNDVLVLKKTDTPYLHFEFVKTANEDDVTGKKKGNATHDSGWKEKVPIDIMKQIANYYQPGIDGHGMKATIKEFGLSQYGINESQQFSRLWDKYNTYKGE